jgi:hypothetical protein
VRDSVVTVDRPGDEVALEVSAAAATMRKNCDDQELAPPGRARAGRGIFARGWLARW